MTGTAHIRLPKAKSTTFAGVSLASSLYTVPLTLFLRGNLGAGKTTFLQGFAEGLGIRERLTSPTYALEQRYTVELFDPLSIHSPLPALPQWGRCPPWGRENIELLHIDLYRIDPKEAKDLVESSDDFQGIRCIEWSEKISEKEKTGLHIDLKFEDHKNTERSLDIQFHDIALPSRAQIETWRKETALLKPICKHCDTVGRFAEKIAHTLLERGVIVRPETVRRAGELHDLLRFLDFQNPSLDPPPVWKKWMAQYPNLKHEAACALFLREQGFDALATIIEPHGLMFPSPKRPTIEQKVLFYADKRTIVDRVVSIDERFEDFKERYGKGKVSSKHTQWYEEVCAIERELFPEGVPF
ncbi:tRNA (adenosine(37)-N6)-threonylcarbamoyltransferase complex ATPase subunit type 1 TsaE [Candidatus Peregrinibacteria bacterium]|nr:tRNA (adenosine(37)-N6)-threonylcarbamoyltransferase complex ATPase subunit type 1 TsaE [Candidatus Peregrinibacteria bacterium]